MEHARGSASRGHQLDLMVRKATNSYAGILLIVSVCFTVFFAVSMEGVAAMLGPSTIWRSNLAYDVEFTMPSPLFTNQDTKNMLDGVREVVEAGLLAVGTSSMFLVSWGLLSLSGSTYLYFKECRQQKGREWDRHALMTVLLWLLSIALMCEAYFFYVPARTEGGVLGAGPPILYQPSIAEQVELSVQIIGDFFQNQPVTVGDVAAADRSQLSAMPTVWATTSVVSLAITISMIIGATTAARPQVEFNLKKRRALGLVLSTAALGLCYILASSSQGRARLGSSTTIAERGIQKLAELQRMFDKIGNATYSGRSASLLTDIRGSNGRPVLFLGLLRQAQILEKIDGSGLGPNGIRFLTGSARVNSSASVLGAEGGNGLVAPLYNRISTSPRLQWCLSYGSQAEFSAAQMALRTLEGILPQNRAAALPLRLPIISEATQVNTSGNTTTGVAYSVADQEPLLDSATWSLIFFVVSTCLLVLFLCTMTVLVLFTPSRGMDQATQNAAADVLAWTSGRLRGDAGWSSIDAEAACARCLLWSCCCGTLPLMCHPTVKVKPPSHTTVQEQSELSAVSSLHEAVVTAGQAMWWCSETTVETAAGHAQMSLSKGDRALSRRSQQPFSPLVKAGIERSAQLGIWLRTVSIAILVTIPLAHLVQSNNVFRVVNICSCSYARIAGLENEWGKCRADWLEIPVDQLMGHLARRAVHQNILADVTFHIIHIIFRVLLVGFVYVYARQSRDLERAMESSERQRAALQSRVRFLSHECRVPLNSVVLGLDFCQEGAKTVRKALSIISSRQKGQELAVQDDTGWPTNGLAAMGLSGPETGLSRSSRSPITSQTSPDAVLQRTQVLLEDASGVFEETLPSLEAATEAMQTTLNDVLDLQHIESGKLQISKRFNPLVPGVLFEAQRTFASQAEGVGVRILTFNSHPRSSQSFECDPTRIRGAIYNYLSNALKWSRPDEALVKRLAAAPSRASDATRDPHVVLGCSRLPPHLWRGRDWTTASEAMGSSIATKLHRIVRQTSDDPEYTPVSLASISSDDSSSEVPKKPQTPTSRRHKAGRLSSRCTAGPISSWESSPSDMSDAQSQSHEGSAYPDTGIRTGQVWDMRPSAEQDELPRAQSEPSAREQAVPLQVVTATAAGDSHSLADASVCSLAWIAPDTLDIYDDLLRLTTDSTEIENFSGVRLLHPQQGIIAADRMSSSGGSSDGRKQRQSQVAPASAYRLDEGADMDDDFVCLWVLDEGPGIQRHDWDKVFTPFETLHSGILTAEGQGSGLGLAITATVIRMHGGCVGFSSCPGEGSVFFLWIRMRIDPDVLPNENSMSSSGERSRLSMRPSRAGSAEKSSSSIGPHIRSLVGGSTSIRLQSLPGGIHVSVKERDAYQSDLTATTARAKLSDASRPGAALVGSTPVDVSPVVSDPKPAPSGCKRRKVRRRKREQKQQGQETQSTPGIHGAQAYGSRQNGLAAATEGTGAKYGVRLDGLGAAPRRVVLVVDDSRTNRLFLSRMVRAVDRSILVLTAGDGLEGLEVLQQRVKELDESNGGAAGAQNAVAAAKALAVDLVLLDFSMPRMSGPEMARAVREHDSERVRGVRIIGVTGNALPEDQDVFRSSGAERILCKPVRRAQVAEVIGSLK